MKIHESHTDQLTSAPLSMSTDHSYIHRGKAFTLSGKSGSVAAGSSTANLGELRIAQGSTFSGGSATTATVFYWQLFWYEWYEGLA